VLQNAGAGGEQPSEAVPVTSQDSSEMMQQAYQQGAEHARRDFAEEQRQKRQLEIEAMQRANDEHERALRERIEVLQKREYRAPALPMACKEEREAALRCYRETRGMKPGEVVSRCHQAAEDLDKCATLVRDAAMSKIVANVLK